MAVDEGSKILGQLQSDAKHIRSTVDKIQAQVSNIAKETTINKEVSKSAHKRLDELEPQLASVVNFKNKWLGVITVIGVIVGSISTAAIKIFTNFWGS